MMGTNKIWYGKSNSTPIELITTLNLEENVGSSGGSNITDYYLLSTESDGITATLTNEFKFFLSAIVQEDYLEWKVGNPLPELKTNIACTPVVIMNGMFNNLTNITSLDLSKFEFYQVHTMNNFLNNTPKLTTVKVRHKGDGTHIKWVGTNSTKIFTTTESIPNPVVPGLGKTFDWNGFRWLVCHIDTSNRYKYCITKYIIKDVQWSTTNTTTGGYAASNIKLECDQFAKDTGIDQLDYVIDTGVGKVFIPTKEQMQGESGGFSYFDSDSNRVAELNGTERDYWTATPQNSWFTRHVNSGGGFNDSEPYASYGFRPCIAIQY